MKIKVEIITKNGKTYEKCYLNGQKMNHHIISRIVTGSIHETCNGIFSQGEITYTREDKEKQTFEQPEELINCNPKIMIDRIIRVKKWITENDKTYGFELDV